MRSSSHMSRSLFEQGPSVATVTVTPSRSIRATGATPLEIFMLLCGLCDTVTPRAARTAMSSSVTWTQCAPIVRGVSTPSRSRWPTGVAP